MRLSIPTMLTLLTANKSCTVLVGGFLFWGAGLHYSFTLVPGKQASTVSHRVAMAAATSVRMAQHDEVTSHPVRMDS